MRRAAMLLCLTGLLAACGTDKAASPGSLPPLSASAPAATPTAAPPVAVPKPADADAFTSEGAASFVRYYVDVINEAFHTNDPTLLIRLSSDQCEGCQKYVQSILSAKARRATLRTTGLSVTSAVAPAIMQRETTVLMDFDADGFTATDPAGAVVAKGLAKSGLSAELRCVRQGDRWLIMGFRLLAPPA